MIVWKEHHFYVLCHPSLRQGTVMNMSPENVVLLLHQHFRLRINMTAAHLSDICSDLNHSMPVSSVLWGASEIWLRVAPSSWFLIKPIGVVGDIGDLEYQVEIGIFVGNMENLDLDCCVPPCIRAPAKGAPQCYFCISVVFTWEDLERRYWQSYCNTVVVCIAKSLSLAFYLAGCGSVICWSSSGSESMCCNMQAVAEMQRSTVVFMPWPESFLADLLPISSNCWLL